MKNACITIAFCLGFSNPSLFAQETNATDLDTVNVLNSFKVAIKEAPPFILKNGGGNYSGLSISLWNKIAENLDTSFEYQEYPDLISMLNAVENGEVDVCISPVTINAHRIERLKFSQPFYVSSLGIAMHKGKNSAWMGFLSNLFSFNFFKAVMVLFAILFIFGLFIWLAERKKNSEMFPPGAKGLGDGFWWSAVTMTTVGYGDKAPMTKLGRLIGLIWMFAAIILISSLTASIASALTVSTLGSNIEEVRDLRKYTLATIAGSSSEDFLDANRLKYKEYVTPLEALEAVSAKKVDAFVYDTPIMKFFIHENNLEDDVEVISFKLTTDYYGLVTAKQSDVLEKINPILLEMLNSPYWKEQLEIYYSDDSSD